MTHSKVERWSWKRLRGRINDFTFQKLKVNHHSGGPGQTAADQYAIISNRVL